jgi:hypothetical protein
MAEVSRQVADPQQAKDTGEPGQTQGYQCLLELHDPALSFQITRTHLKAFFRLNIMPLAI